MEITQIGFPSSDITLWLPTPDQNEHFGPQGYKLWHQFNARRSVVLQIITNIYQRKEVLHT